MEIQELILKVLKLYRKFGIKSVTMDDVAKELCISKKTLYELVADKHQLVKMVIDYEHECQKQNEQRNDKSALDRLFDLYSHVATYIKEFNPSMFYDLKKYYPDIYYQSMKFRRERILGRMRNNLKQGIEEGVFRSDLNIELITKLHLLSVESIQDNDIFQDDISPVEIFKEMYKFYIRAIVNADKINMIDNKIKELEEQFNV